MAVPTQRSFAAGEISPSLYARVDTNKYQSGLRTCRNAYVRKDSGVANRAGTKFIAEVKDSTKATRLISKDASDGYAILLEFGNLYIRLYRNGELLYGLEHNITGVTQAAQAVVTSNSHQLANGTEILIYDVGGMTELNDNRYFVSDETLNTFKIKDSAGAYINSSGFGAYTSGGHVNNLAQATTTYTEAELFELQYSRNIVTHPSHAPAYVSSGYTPSISSVSVSDITFESWTPNFGSFSNSGAAGSTTTWAISCFHPERGESTAGYTTSSSATPTSGAPITLTWGGKPLATECEVRVYKKKNGLFGFIGTASPESPYQFIDDGISADTTILPPVDVNPFSAAGYYPSVIGETQQRTVYASTTYNPEKLWMAQTGSYRYANMNISTPSQSTDSFSLTLAGKKITDIKFVVDLGKLVIFTLGGEYILEGDSSGIYKPAETFPKQTSSNGCGDVAPVIIDNNALYLQRDNQTVRDLSFDINVDGYKGNDLTIFSSHLFEDVTIVDWAYQKSPDSVVWVVLSNGEALSLTYLKEQEIFGWARHDFGEGLAESVCVASEAGIENIYFIIKRTINGGTVRYIEKMQSRKFTDIVDCAFMDSHLSYDGRNAGSTTMTLSGGSTWAYDEDLTLTASSSVFVSGDVGNAIFMYLYDTTVGSPTYGEIVDTLRCTISAYTSGTVVTVRAHKTVPASLQGVASTDWARAVDQLSGLDHLEGETVAVFADGNVVASPNNASYVTVTVSSGSITLDKPYAVIHVGLPFTTDIQTLDVDNAAGETLADKYMRVAKVTVHMEKTRGLFFGSTPPTDDSVDPLEGLYELKVRSQEGYDEPVSLSSNKAVINIQPEWNSNGRIFIRQVDPLPMSILALSPDGNFPFKGGQ